MNNTDVPIWEKYTLTIEEASKSVSYTHLDVYKGQHKKSVIALWVVLIASVSFGVYKNFTAIDQHTTHEVCLLYTSYRTVP